jgi:Helix-turn-helix domain
LRRSETFRSLVRECGPHRKLSYLLGFSAQSACHMRGYMIKRGHDSTLWDTGLEGHGMTVDIDRASTLSEVPVPTFAAALHRLRQNAGLSFRKLSARVHFDPADLSRVESGRQGPSLNLAAALDDEFATGGLFTDLLVSGGAGSVGRGGAEWEAADVVRGLNASDLGPREIDSLHEIVFELCCQYPYRPAGELRADAVEVMRHVGRLRERRLRLAEHRELLVTAGWLALLVSCLEYDLGARVPAEATRAAAISLGREAGHTEIEAWGYEIAAWMAVTQGRYEHEIAQAQAGLAIESRASVAVQLATHEAKGRARLGDAQSVRAILEASRLRVEGLDAPQRPDHHFVIDPVRWMLHAMDSLRQIGDDDQAAEYAAELIRRHTALDGTVRAPMPVAEAHATLGIIAVRNGDLDGASQQADLTLTGERRSLPSLLLAADELAAEMRRRYPAAPQVVSLDERLATLRASAIDH